MDPLLRRFVFGTIGISLAVGVPVAAASHGWLPAWISEVWLVLVVASPAVVASVLTARSRRASALRRLVLRPSLRAAPQWWVAALAMPFLVNATALFMHGVRGGRLPDLPGSPPPEQQAIPLLALPLVLLVLSLFEELGWRRFALPRLQQRFSALTASLILGTIWGLWHLPMSLVDGSTQASIDLAWYVPATLAMSVIFTWLYNSSGGSLAVVVVLHAAVQASNIVLPVLPSVTGTSTVYEGTVLIYGLLAIGLTWSFGATHLSRIARQVESVTPTERLRVRSAP